MPRHINNILAVLSKALRYADDVELIDAPRRVGLLKVARPEIECWGSSSTPSPARHAPA